MILSEEKMKIARQAKNVSELLQLAKENGFEMTESAAEMLFSRMHREGELTDEELSGVSGGRNWYCIYYTSYSPEGVKYRFAVGSHVEVITNVGWLSDHVYTTGATVVDRMVARDAQFGGYIAYYQISGEGFNGQWIPEYDIEGGYEIILNNGDFW